MRKGETGNGTKKKRLTKDEIKDQLFSLLINGENVEAEDLDEKADKGEKPEDAATIIKDYEEIIHIKKKKNIICIAYQNGKVL